MQTREHSDSMKPDIFQRGSTASLWCYGCNSSHSGSTFLVYLPHKGTGTAKWASKLKLIFNHSSVLHHWDSLLRFKTTALSYPSFYWLPLINRKVDRWVGGWGFCVQDYHISDICSLWHQRPKSRKWLSEMKCLEQCEVWAISYLGQQVVSLTEGNIWTNSTKSNKLAVNFTFWVK